MHNLERLVCAMGFPAINPESLSAIREFVGDPIQLGRFTTLAKQHNLSVLIGSEAKREYSSLMAQGAEMFAPMSPAKALNRDDTQRLIKALHRMVKAHDDLSSNTDGEMPPLDPGCNDCTLGNTPGSFDTGLCAYHYAKQVLAHLPPPVEAAGAHSIKRKGVGTGD